MTREEAIEVYNGLINPKIKEAFEFFAPELRESEDGRIIKWIANYIHAGVFTEDEHPMALKAIDWLEKQKEPENTSASTMAPSCWECEQKEQKPIQSDDEKEYVRVLKSLISDFIRDNYKTTDISFYQKIYDWLDGRHIEQKPAEWSKEDEKMLKCCLIALNHYEKTCNIGDLLPTKFNIDGYLASVDKVKSWLKSLRPNKQD